MEGATQSLRKVENDRENVNETSRKNVCGQKHWEHVDRYLNLTFNQKYIE